MTQPTKQYMLSLCIKLGKTPRELEEQLTLDELMDFIAFDYTQDEKWRNKYQLELEAAMGDTELEALKIQALLMGLNTK